jgi:hypothetical protein
VSQSAYFRKYVRPRTFVLCLALYLVAGSVLIGMTSGGWTAIVETKDSLEVSGIIIILSVVATWVVSRDNARIARVDLRAVACVLTIQLVSLLFNKGDKGDGPGTYLFIQQLGWKCCSYAALYHLYLFPLYYLAVAAFVAITLSTIREQRPATKE